MDKNVHINQKEEKMLGKMLSTLLRCNEFFVVETERPNFFGRAGYDDGTITTAVHNELNKRDLLLLDFAYIPFNEFTYSVLVNAVPLALIPPEFKSYADALKMCCLFPAELSWETKGLIDEFYNGFKYPDDEEDDDFPFVLNAYNARSAVSGCQTMLHMVDLAWEGFNDSDVEFIEKRLDAFSKIRWGIYTDKKRGFQLKDLETFLKESRKEYNDRLIDLSYIIQSRQNKKYSFIYSTLKKKYIPECFHTIPSIWENMKIKTVTFNSPIHDHRVLSDVLEGIKQEHQVISFSFYQQTEETLLLHVFHT